MRVLYNDEIHPTEAHIERILEGKRLRKNLEVTLVEATYPRGRTRYILFTDPRPAGAARNRLVLALLENQGAESWRRVDPIVPPTTQINTKPVPPRRS